MWGSDMGLGQRPRGTGRWLGAPPVLLHGLVQTPALHANAGPAAEPEGGLVGGWAAVAMGGSDRCSGGGTSDLPGMGTLERSLRAERQTLRSPKHGGAVES